MKKNYLPPLVMKETLQLESGITAGSTKLIPDGSEGGVSVGDFEVDPNGGDEEADLDVTF